MKSSKFYVSLLTVISLFCLSGFSSLANAALTPDELMAKVREFTAEVAATAKEREAAFRAEMEEQRKLTADTVGKRNAAEALSNDLIAQVEANRARKVELDQLLETNKGNLGELFGVTRQIAGETSGEFSESLVTTQLVAAPGEEDRLTFMQRIAAATALPSIKDLERMWFEIMDEMKAQTETVRYTAPVLQQDGTTTVDMEVVRIGSFGAIGNGEYITYLSSEGKLATLSNQPPEAELRALARNLQNSTQDTGYLPAIVDPSRGALLGVYVERPSLWERVQEGEVVVYVILAVGIIGVLAAAFQYVYLFIAKIAVNAQLKHLSTPVKNNALGRMLLAVKGDSTRDFHDELPEVVELRISEAVLREIPKLERFQSFLRLAVAAGPLLGLIGTVIGMILTFQSITASGSSDPKLMAQGIGQAMIATVMGLGVAIPLLFLNAGLVSLSKSVVHVLEEESTNLMADRLVGKS
jgi:biopolymer transport protein ExbB